MPSDKEWEVLVKEYRLLKAKTELALAKLAFERSEEEKQEEMERIEETVALKNRRINIFRQFDWYARKDNFVHEKPRKGK